MLRHRYIIAVVGCMIVHAVLCLYQIGKADLWHDELRSLDSVRYSFKYILLHSFEEHNHPPLYFAILWIWHRLFGDGEATLRLLSTIFSVCTVPVIAKIGSVVFNKQVGVMAAFVTACSYFLAIYAQEVRAYSMLCLLSSLSILYFIYYLREYIKTSSISPRQYWMYLCIATANLYVHPYAVFVQAAQFIVAFIIIFAYKLPAKRIVATGATMLLLTIPVIVGYLLQSNATKSLLNNAGWIPTPNINDFIRTLMFVYMPKNSIRATVYLYLAISLFVLSGVRAGIALHRYRRAFWKAHWGDLLFFTTLGMIVVVPFFSSLVLSPFFTIRYSIPASVVLYLILARGIGLLPWKTVQISLVMVLGAALMWTTDTVWRGQGKKPQFRQAIQHIEQHSDSQDIIIFDNDVVRPPRTFNPIEYYIERYSTLKDGESDSRILNAEEHSIDFIVLQLLDTNGWYALSNHRSLSIDRLPKISAILQQIDCTIDQPMYYRVLVVSLSNCSIL